MNTQNKNQTHPTISGLRFAFIILGLILFLTIGGNVASQADNKQFVVGQALSSAQ